MNISKEFQSITGKELEKRSPNCLFNKVERKDRLFEEITWLFFCEPQKFNQLVDKIELWLRKEKTDTVFALAGYLYYLLEDFTKARGYFLETIHQAPDNLDSWVDLAFALRHLGEYTIANSILFNLFYVIYYYKFFNLYGCDYFKIKSLVGEISKKRQGFLSGEKK